MADELQLGLLQTILQALFAKPDLAGRPVGPQGISMQQMRSLASDPGAIPGFGSFVSPGGRAGLQYLLKWLQENTDVAKAPPSWYSSKEGPPITLNPPPGGTYMDREVTLSRPGQKPQSVPNVEAGDFDLGQGWGDQLEGFFRMRPTNPPPESSVGLVEMLMKRLMQTPADRLRGLD